jgi:succinyl-diaminopimelate desuccinylase
MVNPQKAKQVLQEIDRTKLIDLAVALVRINSVWDPETGTGEKEAAEYVAHWATGQGFEVAVEEVAPGRPNVVVAFGSGPGARHLLFEGHTDVVTPGDPDHWQYNPFGAVIEGNRMYGRGANDTKGNLAAMLIAMAALKRSGVELSGRIIGGILCDEEDLMLGVQDFIRRGHAEDLTAAVICEPQDGFICCTQKGAIRARYTVRGRMSHGAMPLSGLNPAPALAHLIEGLGSMELDAVDRHGRDELLGWPSFTPTVIRAPVRGPGQLNVVPESGMVLVDIRTNPGQSHPEIISRLESLAGKVREDTMQAYALYDRRLGNPRNASCSVDVEILADRPTTETDRKDPIVLAAHWATQKILGTEPVYAGVPGATDGTYLRAWKGIPIVTLGAGDRAIPHQVDEWVDLDQLADMAAVYALTALAYLAPEEPIA